MPAPGSSSPVRSRAVSVVLFLFVGVSLQATTRNELDAKEPAGWKETQQSVTQHVGKCEFQEAIDELSELIRTNPDFAPAYERRAWVTLDWLDLRDDVALVDAPLRNRPMADPATDLGNVEPPSDARRIFLADRFHESYAPPAEMASIQQDIDACRRLYGKNFNDIAIDAFVSEFLGNIDRARIILGNRCNNGRGTAREYLTYSRVLRAQGNGEGAIASLEIAWKNPETRAQAGARELKLLRAMRKTKEAEALMERWGKESPTDAQFLFSRLAVGSDQESIFEDYKSLMTLLPQEAGFPYGVAIRDIQLRKDFEASMDHLNQAIALKPRSLLPYFARSALWSRQGQTQLAIRDITTAIEINPYFDKSYDMRAKYYQKSGDVEQSRQDEKTELWLKGLYDLYAKFKSRPDKPEAAIALARHCQRGEEWDLAQRVLTTCLKTSADNADLLRERGQIYVAMGKLDEALADANSVVKLDPDQKSYSLRGDVFIRRREWDAAVKDLDRAKCIDDRLEKALRRRAQWHTAEGRVDLARADEARANRVSQAVYTAP